ncbi:MAG: chemotaxis protein CheW [Anaerolineales bacterium]|nr:chemotaxis protein CheW [Anaerolineales bacterium]
MSRKRKLEDGLSNLFSPQSEEEVSRSGKKKDSASVDGKEEKVSGRKQRSTLATPVKKEKESELKPSKGKKDQPPDAGEQPAAVSERTSVQSIPVDIEDVVNNAPRPQILKPVEADREIVTAAEEVPHLHSKQPAETSVKDLYQPSAGEESIMEEEALEAAMERYVIFDLGDITFGVEVNSVLTIIKILPICPIPHSADYLSGLINLRGQIIPVLCLGKRLGLLDRPETANSRIVVVEQEKRLFGFIVDYVRAVEQIQVDYIKEPSRMMTNVRNEYLSGIAETEHGLILLLELQRLLQR